MMNIQNKFDATQCQQPRRVPLLCLLGFLAVTAPFGWAQDKKGTAPATNSNPVGTYALVTVDGNKVPCTVQHEGHAMAISSGKFVINSDGTCASKMVLAGREAPIEVKANYTRDGAKLNMKWVGAGTTVGTVAGDTFTMNNEGMVLVYRK
jgi:hypothetical protein